MFWQARGSDIKIRLPLPLALALAFACTAAAHADPLLSSWITGYSAKYARIYTTDANKTSGASATTWTNGQQTQSLSVYAGVQQIDYSSAWVYLYSSGLGSHIMGPWYNDAARTTAFVNLPVNQKDFFRIPRTPTVPATKSVVQGEIGFFVDGVHAFDSTDATSYTGRRFRPGRIQRPAVRRAGISERHVPANAAAGAYTVNATFGPNAWSLTNGFTVN